MRPFQLKVVTARGEGYAAGMLLKGLQMQIDMASM
jgi:hypothetical protein